MARKKKPAAKPRAKKKAVGVQPGPVVLRGQPSIKNIEELKTQLADAIDTDSDVIVVDAGKVESIDTAALQLLIAFSNSAREQSRTIECRDPSGEFRPMAELADLSGSLRLKEPRGVEVDDSLCPVF